MAKQESSIMGLLNMPEMVEGGVNPIEAIIESANRRLYEEVLRGGYTPIRPRLPEVGTRLDVPPAIGMLAGSNNVITDPEQIRNILQPTQFAIGPGFDDQETFKEPGEFDPVITSTNEIPPEDQPQPGDLGEEDSIFQILYDTIIGCLLYTSPSPRDRG